MYAYIDETGNTGTKILDEDQPLFITAALLTRSDFDHRFGEDVKRLARSIGTEEIHANRLGLGRLEDIAPELLKIIRKAGPAFTLSRVEKRYVLATKVFDTLFDAHENKAVPWHVYNVRPLRLMMVFKLASLLDFNLAQQFWNALMDGNPTRARAGMVEFCQSLLPFTIELPDERSRQVISEALEWAAQNPESLEFAGQSRDGRKGHSPNLIAFGNLLSGIEIQSNIWGRSVEVIKHDRQHEFESNIKFWHQMFSNARPDVITLPLGEKVVLRKVFGSRLEMTSAAESAGIQIIDVIMWIFSRIIRGDDVPKICRVLMSYVFSRAHQDDFSFSGVGSATEEVLQAISKSELQPEQTEKAHSMLQEIEEVRKENMRRYAAGKASVEV